MEEGKEKICPQCKRAFSCYTENCWCAELPRIMPLSKDGDCLCPECLKKEIAKAEDKKQD